MPPSPDGPLGGHASRRAGLRVLSAGRGHAVPVGRAQARWHGHRARYGGHRAVGLGARLPTRILLNYNDESEGSGHVLIDPSTGEWLTAPWSDNAMPDWQRLGEGGPCSTGARARRVACAPAGTARRALAHNPEHRCDSCRAERAPWRAPVTETLPALTYQQFINGSFVDAAWRGQDVENPATGQVVAKVPGSAAEDVDRAVDAAAEAFATWKMTTPQPAACPPQDRGFLDAHADGLAPSSARPRQADRRRDRRDPGLVDLFRFFAGAARVPEGLAATEYLAGHTSFIRRDPVGVVASIAPWNYPLYMASWKLGPALATGNTVVLKPSIRTPLSALGFAQILAEHLPPGVVNVLSGAGSVIGDELVSHPKVRMVSITGDTATGKRIAQLAAGTVKRLHLELGGKAPVIIFDDADLDLAAETLKAAGYWNAARTAPRPRGSSPAPRSTTTLSASSATRSARSSGAIRPMPTTSTWAR